MPNKSLRLAGLSLGVLVLAACGGTSPTNPTTNPTANSTPTASVPTGPPTAKVSLVGGAGLPSSIQAASVTCQEPSLQGELIQFYGQSPSGTIGTFITVRSGVVAVRLAAGSGTAYTERDFSSTGVTNFNPAVGASFSGPVTEITAPGTAKGKIPNLTSVSGTVSCANQQPGSGTITIAGTTAPGVLSGALSPIHVSCLTTTSYPEQVLITGVGQAGSTPVFIEVGGSAPGGATNAAKVFVVESPNAATGLYYATNTQGVTFTGNQVSIQGTVTEQVTGAVPEHTLTVSGQVTCGSTTTT